MYGGTKLISDESRALYFLKAIAILFLAALLFLVAVAGPTWPFFGGVSAAHHLLDGENMMYFATVAAIPLAVRAGDSILADFENNATFAPLNGDSYL